MQFDWTPLTIQAYQVINIAYVESRWLWKEGPRNGDEKTEENFKINSDSKVHTTQNFWFYKEWKIKS